ncbi:MAG: hypothetical protein AABM43_01155 [Actinomycetota bacterium]
MLGAGDYLLGAAELVAVVLGAAATATRVRSRLLLGWTGPPAWLADLVLGLALVLGVAELLGSFGAFREFPFVLAVVIAGLAVRARVRPGPGPRPGLQVPPAPPSSGIATAAALVVAGLVIAHWSIGVRVVLDAGITNFDSTWYHGPLAAHFAQGHSTWNLDFIAPQFLAWFYPANSELLHGVGILAFGRDSLSPLINAGWLAGTLLAVWCIGRPYGVGALSLIGAAVVLDAGALADQAGSMRNDMPAIFFLTAAAAVAINARASQRDPWPAPGALVVVGLAAGLAAGVKLNYLVPAAGLAVGLVAISAPGTRRRATAAVGLPLLVGCGYWYLRNLVQAGNPFPWVKSFGPVNLPAPDQALGGRRQESVLGYLFDGSTWRHWFLPGLHHSFGWLWPLVAGLAVLALVVCLSRRQARLVRVLGAVGLLTAVAWVASPASAAGPSGMPLSFESGLRYLAPALILGFALLPVVVGADRGPRRAALLVLLLVALAFADASAAPWYSGYVAGAIAVGVAAVAVAALLGSWRLRLLPRPALAAVAGGIVLLVVGAGWFEQRRYLDHRYADPGFTTPGLDAAFKWALSLDDQRIATTATRQYPLWGTELSNRVQFAGLHRPHAGFVRASTCEQWRRLLDAGDYDYVVVSLDRIGPGGPSFPREARWTRDPHAKVVLKTPPTVVFKIDGPLAVSRCGRSSGNRGGI